MNSRDSRREEVRSRRKTLRQSALDAKRGTADEADLDVPPARVTRGALRTQASRSAIARQVEEKKLRKAITDREVKKAKPPFNPYVRVKHTGLSPFKSFQDAQKRSKTAPWRTQASKPAPASSGSGNRAAHPTRAPAPAVAAISKPPVHLSAPEIKMAAGVIQFPMLPHMHHAQITFRAPAKVQPIPLPLRPTRSVLPVKNESAKENAKSTQTRKPVRGVSVKAQPAREMQMKQRGPPAQSTQGQNGFCQKKPTSAPVQGQKLNAKAKPQNVPAKSKEVVQPAKKATAAATKNAAQSVTNARLTRAKSAAPQKLTVKPPIAEVPKTVRGRRTEPPTKKILPLGEAVNREPIKDEVAPVIEAKRIELPARVLRSSSRLQHRDKENLPAETLELPHVKRRRTKKQTTVAPIDEPECEQTAASETPREQAEPVVQPEPIDERVKGLEERSSKLEEETKRLRALADQWVATKCSSENLPQSAIDEIDAITGQTYLLTSKKFVQYKGLIEGAYNNPKTTLDDLDGFWEMVYIQVEQLENQYRKLDEMKRRNWVSDSPAPSRKPTKTSAKVPKRPVAKTNFRKFLAEKKKASAAEPTVGESAREEPAAARPDPQLSPGLNMSVDEVAASPRSAHSSLRSAKTPRRSSRLLFESPAVPPESPLRCHTPRRATQPQLETPLRKSVRKSSARSVRNSPFNRSARVADSPLRASGSLCAESPRARENARRASSSIRLSTLMMRVSTAVANELDTSNMDPLS